MRNLLFSEEFVIIRLVIIQCLCHTFVSIVSFVLTVLLKV